MYVIIVGGGLGPCLLSSVARAFNVLIHTFQCSVSLNDCRPAPKLKDVELSESKARELYLQCIQIMRVMYQESKLVHADLSEFNML